MKISLWKMQVRTGARRCSRASFYRASHTTTSESNNTCMTSART